MADKNAPNMSLPPRQSGVKTVLSYTGIPPSWLDKRPKLPSRNWLIFLSVTSSIVGLYVYDRRECKKIRQSYVEKVKHLSEATIDPFEFPRKVTVYGAKWPGDEEYEQGIKYFRKYVKPILVAAGIDYDMVSGKRHGDIANRVAEKICLRRRLDVGLDADPVARKVLPTYKPLFEREKHELEGGIVIIGRPSFKEYMAGLCKGWTQGLQSVDRDEELAHILENDSYFDELPEPEVSEDGNGELSVETLKPKPLSPQNSPVFSPLMMTTQPQSRHPQSTQIISSSTTADSQLSTIPPLPPLLFVPFTNYIGISQIPLMIWGFFNQRHKVRSGSEAAYRLVMGSTRPISVPESLEDAPIPLDGVDKGDLDFEKEAESYYKNSLKKFHDEIEKLRQTYYEALPKKLAVARELARGMREPTKEEYDNPPPTEVELRAERLKKERRWRDDVEGWDIVKPSAQVQWDERLRNSLTVFVNPEDEAGSLS